MRQLVALLASLFLCAAHTSARAQTLDVWPGAPPGSENWKQVERSTADTSIGTVVFNVVRPTVTAYLPERSRATRTAVIIAPGGGFVALPIDLEGRDVATWLQQRGIAAFVLKYRIIEKRGEGIPAMNMDEVSRYGIADGIQALKVIRARAAEFDIDPERIGVVGFSAGAIVASGMVFNRNAAERPSFAAFIYGAPFGSIPRMPKHLPPLFMAWAQNDDVALEPILRFQDALEAAGHQPEVHIYAAGGHGFGMKKQGTSSDYWIDAFYYWLEAYGFTAPPMNDTP